MVFVAFRIGFRIFFFDFYSFSELSLGYYFDSSFGEGRVNVIFIFFFSYGVGLFVLLYVILMFYKSNIYVKVC